MIHATCESIKSIYQGLKITPGNNTQIEIERDRVTHECELNNEATNSIARRKNGAPRVLQTHSSKKREVQ